MPASRQTVFAFPPKHRPLHFPDLWAIVGVFDAIPLPRLLLKYRRVGHQVADFAGRTATRQSRILPGATPFLAHFRPRTQDLWLLHPAMEVGGNLGHEDLPTLLQTVEELAVASVQFVERPGGHANAVAQSPIDQSQGDLRLCAKLHLVGNVVFFRRTGSLAQSSGR